MKLLLKKIPRNSLPIILCVLMAIALVYTINLRINAASIGGGIGSSVGALAGKAIGSFEGLTEGRKKGNEDGKAKGLSAEDTEAAVGNRMQKVENLEVLVASVKLSNFHQIGEEEKPDYAALYLVNGKVVFTVDLSMVAPTLQGNVMHITLPEPVATLYIDDETIEKVAEYQKHFFSGSAEDGFDAYRNTMAELQSATEETLTNYDELIASAKASAEKQVKMIAASASTRDYDVIIDWEA